MQEQQLFDYLADCCYPDLVMAKNKMSRWDCYSPSTYHRVELKCRTKHYDTLVLEKKKYDAMLEVCTKNLDLPMYICSTPKGVYRYNLFQIKPNWESGYFKKTTNFSNNNYIPKMVTMLPISEAEKL